MIFRDKQTLHHNIYIIITKIIFSKVLMAEFDDHFSSSLPPYQSPSGALDHTLSPTHRRTYLHHISLLLGCVTEYSLEKSTSEEVNSCVGYSTIPDKYHFWGTTALCKPVKRWLIAILNSSVLGFTFVFHDKAERTQQGNLLVKRAPKSA